MLGSLLMQLTKMLKEFKPSLLFLARFLGIYFFANLLYGLYIESFEGADPLTFYVASQVSWLLGAVGEPVHVAYDTISPKVSMICDQDVVLNVFEGCNGINVMVIFVAFMVAFGGAWKKMVWFLPLGLLCIHFFNVCRIAALYFAAQHFQQYFYYVHKYLFTAAIYAVVFLLWYIWIVRFHVNARQKKDQA